MPRTMPRSVIVRTGISGSGIVSSTAMIAASSSRFAAVAMTGILHPFERERDSLADSDAHGRKRELAAGLLQLLGRGQSETRSGHAEGVTERDRAAVGVHSRIVVSDPEFAKHGKSLRGERLIELDHVEVGDLESQPLHQLF